MKLMTAAAVLMLAVAAVIAQRPAPAAPARPSRKVRVSAAQLRVDSDRQTHRRTPRWIKELARG